MPRSCHPARIEAFAHPEEAAPKVGLDRVQRAAGQDRDLLERPLTEEAQRHYLAIWLGEAGEGASGRTGAFGLEGRLLRTRAGAGLWRTARISHELTDRSGPAHRPAASR